ncbi:unnamed protein product [Scytosiphon promiscuus]
MGKIEAEKCSVCKENPSKYRCPGCSAPYCSLACNKAHKAGGGGDGDKVTPPCSGKRAGGPLQAQNGSSGNRQSPSKRPRGDEHAKNAGADGVPVEGGESIAGSSAAACVRKGRDQWRGGREDREEEEWQMSADQRERISRCAWLKAAVRDPKLQALLTEIDQADDREKALAFHRTSSQFGEFMDKMLLEIEEYRKGGNDEPALVAADP